MEILKHYKGIKVYGGDERVPGVNVILKDGDRFRLGELEINAIKTPGHTTSSISFNVIDHSTNQRAVFTGDTLFVGGCGRFFEGTAQDMHESLIKKLGKLPLDTKVYCGHEYTRSNLKFASSVDPTNLKLRAKIQEIQHLSVTVPSTIEQELDINPFMRVETRQLQNEMKIPDPVELMAHLRKLKNQF